MSAVLDLFTLLVFLCVLAGFYAARGMSRKRQRAEAQAERLGIADKVSFPGFILITGTPSPSAPTSAAITTIDSDSMMVWFRPAMICGKA